MTDVRKNVRAVRTFASDAALVRESNTATQNEEQKMPSTTPMAKTQAGTTPHKTNVPAHTPVTEPRRTTAVKQSTSTAVPKKELEERPTQQSNSRKYLNLEEEASRVTPHRAAPRFGDTDSLDEGGGTIIRETKRKRFRLLPAMWQAATEWFDTKKETLHDYQHPHHAITTSDARKEVISAAVEKSVLAPREDFKQLAQRKKTEERAHIESTLIVKDKKAVPPPQWSHTINEEPVLETTPEQAQTTAPISAPAEEQPLQEQGSVPSQATVTPTPVVENTPPMQSEVEEVPPQKTEETIPAEDLHDDAVAAVVQEAPVAQEVAEVDEKPLEVPTAQSVAPKPVASYARASTGAQQTSRFHFVMIAVMLIATVSGVGLSIYLFGNLRGEKAQEVAVVYTVPNLVQAQNQQSFALPSDRQQLLESLTSFTLQAPGVVQLYPTVQESSGSIRPASAQEALSVLAPRTASSFIRGVREMTFGSISGEPFMVLKTGSFDVAFAGMLQWETTMSADLAPLFGTPVIESFDPTARTDTQVRAAFFKDIIAYNKNARILFDEDGADRIVYTFINQQTILITTTRDALQVLVPLIP